MLPPRIRTRVGEIDSPSELKGKWAFEVSMWSFDGETQVGHWIGPFGPYDTEELASDAGREAAKFACETVEKTLGTEPSGKYLDMKNGGILRSWAEH